MKRSLFPVVAILLLGEFLSSAEAQTAPVLLTAALGKNANASTYHIEGTQESSMTDEVQQRREEEMFTLARSSATRYHYDVKTAENWNVVIANGATEWEFQPWRSEYTSRSVPTTEPEPDSPADTIRYTTEHRARYYFADIQRGIDIKTAEFLTPEILSIAGKEIPCYVLHVGFTRAESADSDSGITVWVEKERQLIRRLRSVSSVSSSIIAPLRKVHVVNTITYKIVDLGEDPPATLFAFAVPSAAKRVPRLFLDEHSIDLTGFPAPLLSLKTLDGKDFNPDSLKGRTVLVDFWASWCIPCVQQMKGLAQLALRSGKQGLIIVGINWGDDNLSVAKEFIHENNYDWINLRADNETSKAWMLNGVPLVAIIDPEGKIAYYHTGYQQPEEIAIAEVLRKIDPAFKADRDFCP